MLKQLGRLERTRNILIVGFVVLMAASLVLFYAPGRNSAALAPATSTEVLATVGNDKVTVGELSALKESYQQMFGGQISLAQLGGDRKMLDGLVRQRVIAQESARLGLAASDAEVADSIRKQFPDASKNAAAFERYKQAVTSRYGDIAAYENEVRRQISADKLQAFITAGVHVSDEEVQDDYKRKNTTFDLSYVPIVPDKLAQKIQINDQDLRTYYDQHKTDYRILEQQKKIRYLFIDQAKAGEKLQIPDEDLRAEYEKLAPENKQAGVRVQQIILKVARPDLDATVQAKANNLAQQAHGASGTATEEAFAELAKGNSEDPATAKNGGTVAGVVKKNPNKPDDPYQKVLDLQPGQVTDPIKYGNAYYILRRGDAVAKSFEDAKQELLVSMRNRRAYAAAAQLAERAFNRFKETKDAAKVAQELAADANMKPADMVRETPFVKNGDDVPDIGNSQQFEQAIASLNNAGDIGERTSIKGGFAVPQLVDKKDPRIPEFDEVKDKVAQAARIERAKAQLDQTARELAGSANSPADLKAAAQRLGLDAQDAKDYKLGQPLGQAGTSAAADEAIYNLKTGEVDKTPIKIGDNWVVVGATKRTEADLAEFSKQREQLTQTALSERRSQVFGDFTAAAQERLQRDGQIKIYDDVLAKMADDEPPVAAPPVRRAPPSRPPAAR